MSELSTQTAAPSLKSLLSSDAAKNQLALALPRHMSVDRFARVAITALTRTPKLQECTQSSFLMCLLDLSAMGLEPDGRRAHLIPYGKECTLVIDYKGLVELVRRSGEIKSLRAETVCENDEFAWENGEISHNVNWREDRGAMQAAYAIATLASGETQSAVMTKAEIDGIRNRSRAKDAGPWVTDYPEMAKKTVVRRLCKMLPISSEIMEHISKSDAEFERPVRNVTPLKMEAMQIETTEKEIEQ